ncbi:MAG: Glycine betaine/proline transport system permease protein [Dactylosporangium sp.]|jgi:glycine betaine/proline transport system permease protein|nr:Glycine betaine/proline transport system permease protein [Dactylosporangium sp.]
MPRIHVGDWINALVQFLLHHLGGFFDGLSHAILATVEGVNYVLIRPHALIVLAAFVALAWLASRRWELTLFTLVAFLVVNSMELWVAAMQTLAVVVVAASAALLIGIPVGIWAARSGRVSVAVRPVLDFMQTLPVFVYLLPAVFFFGIGLVPGVVATTVFAIPPAVRLTELGVRQVDQEFVEAAVAFGARPQQVLREVQLPLAVSSIMTGVNQVIMLSLSMVVIAGMVGAQGLGAVVVGAITSLNIGAGFEGGLAVVVLAMYLDRVTAALGTRRRAKARPNG